MHDFHDREIKRSSIRSCHKGVECRSADHRHCEGCIGGRKTAVRVCGSARDIEGSGITSSQSRKGGGPTREDTGGLRAGIGGPTEASSVYRQEMGGGRNKKTGDEEMKTLVTANQKGGVGKTSTLVHLAFDFLERGMRVAVIDLDTQANASYTLQEFESGSLASRMFTADEDKLRARFNNLSAEPALCLISSDAAMANMEKLTMTEAATSFKRNIKVLDECGFDVCLIDTAPSLGVSMAAALFAADYVFSPIELEAYSIQGIKKMVTTIVNIRKSNPGLQFLGMVPSKVDGRNPRHGRHLEELKRAYPQLMIPVGIGLRSSIADALASGMPVWKIKKTAARKAAQEVRAFATHIFEKMEMTQ